MPETSPAKKPVQDPTRIARRASQILSGLLPEEGAIPDSVQGKGSPGAGAGGAGAGGDGWQCKVQLRQSYYARLRTFSSTNWFDKPSALSAFECARHGWINDGVDAVLCESCRGRLVVTIHHSLNAQSKANAVAQLTKKVSCDAHTKLCPWRDNPVPASVVQLSGSSVKEVVAGCSVRLKSLQRCEALPQLCMRFLSSPEYRSVVDGCGWPKGRDIDAAVVLAACGWDAVPLSKKAAAGAGEMLGEREALLQCVMDQRTAGVWNFKTRPNKSTHIDLTKPQGGQQSRGGGGGGKRGRGWDNDGGGVSSDDGDIFTDAQKRARILGGTSATNPSVFRAEFGGSAAFGSGALASWNANFEKVSLGYGWAQQPLGAFSQPAPTVSTAGASSKGGFNPVTEHRPWSPWVHGKFPMHVSGLASGSLSNGAEGQKAWQQSLSLCLQQLMGVPADSNPISPTAKPKLNQSSPAQGLGGLDEVGMRANRSETLILKAQQQMRFVS